MLTFKLITEPTVVVLADMALDSAGLVALVEWLGGAAPQCLPDDWANLMHCGQEAGDDPAYDLLFPHDRYRANGWEKLRTEPSMADVVTDNELLAELAGRKCYNSFGEKAGRSDNESYVANILGAPGKIPHASVLYHAKMTFFFAGISRRMSHELIRHYVGADRSEEGCPSQESTRYTEHPGHFVVHPRMLYGFEGVEQVEAGFERSMRSAYGAYCAYLKDEVEQYKAMHNGVEPKGMDRKRIYEAAAMLLPGAAATSLIWTTNPVALQKLFFERMDEAADLEFQRFARKLRDVCLKRWPNLFRDSNPKAVHT